MKLIDLIQICLLLVLLLIMACEAITAQDRLEKTIRSAVEKGFEAGRKYEREHPTVVQD